MMEQNNKPENPMSFLNDRTDGVFTTEDLMRASGLTREEANEVMESLRDQGVVKLVPYISTLN